MDDSKMVQELGTDNILDSKNLNQALRLAEKKATEASVNEAYSIYQDILKKFPKNRKAIDGIKSLSNKITVRAPKNHNPPEEQIQILIKLFSQGKLQRALDKVRSLLEQFPSSALLYNIHGGIAAGLSRFDAAIDSYKKAIDIKPGYAEAYNNLGNAFQDKNDIKAAIKSYQQALRIKPDYVEAYYNLGIAHKNNGDLENAIKSYQKALKIRPNYAKAYNNMGYALEENGCAEEAMECYEQALRNKPDYVEALNNMGHALEENGYAQEAFKNYEKAIKINPSYTDAHFNLSKMKSYTERDEQFVRMQKIYDDQKITDEQRCHICFALAKAHEDFKDYTNSFTFLKQGNELRKKLLSYDIDNAIKLFKNLKKSYPNLKKNALLTIEKSRGPKPIFILGMPRSGTTLVEQIISAHSEVTGAGELSYVAQLGETMANGTSIVSTEAILKFRENYLTKLCKRSNGSTFVTDKMPMNFRYIGLICSAFPEAKIIHVKRDPSATCWSNYKMCFSTNDIGYCYDLNDLVTYYGLYQDLMQFWQAQYDERIYDLDYESLTISQEKETKQLMRYLELEWQNACLSPQNNNRIVQTASNLQVRQKVYQGSSEQWRKFEGFLDGAFDKL